MSTETIAQIEAERFRLRARVEDVSRDGIEVGDRGHGNVALTCRTGRDFNWFGSGDDALARLSALPDTGGHEVVRAEFADPLVVLNLVEVTQVHVFRAASQMIQQQHYGPAGVVAQAAVELMFEASIDSLLNVREVPEPLRDWIGHRSTIGTWSPMNDRVKRLWEAMTGDRITEAAAWEEYVAGMTLRNRFVHRASPVTREEAEGFIDAAERLAGHLLKVTLPVHVTRRREGAGLPDG